MKRKHISRGRPTRDDRIMEEMLEAINKLKHLKAPGFENNPLNPSSMEEILHRQLHNLITLIWDEEKIPRKWRESIIIPNHKKVDKSKCTNFRRISYFNTIFKILSYSILNRLTTFVELFIRKTKLVSGKIDRPALSKQHMIESREIIYGMQWHNFLSPETYPAHENICKWL